MSAAARARVLSLLAFVALSGCGRDRRFATSLHYQGAAVVRARADAAPRFAADASVRLVGVLGRFGPLLGLSIGGGGGAPAGASYDVALVPLGVGVRLHRASFVGVGAVVATTGGSYEDDAVALGGQAYLELDLGARVRWLSYARLAQDSAVADDVTRRRIEITAALRLGRGRSERGFAIGNGYYLGATVRERQGERFWGLVVGHSLEAAR